jgi:uncharacterized protein
MKNRDEVLGTLRSLAHDLKDQYSVKKIGVFGSVSRGDQEEESDIDILVEFSRPVGFFKFLELEEFLTSMLGAKVDLVTPDALKPATARRILADVAYA